MKETSMRTDRFIATGILALFLVTGSGNAFAAPSGTVGQGNISVYKGGQLADKFTGQNPVEDEALLVCDGKCMIKSSGITLIGANGAKLAIKKDQELFNLLVNEGRVDFVITDSISKVAFYTPSGQYTVADIMFNAGTNNPVRGYMQVAGDGAAEVGVQEGRMVFSTAEGAKTVDSNNRILLAMADVTAGTRTTAGTVEVASTGNGFENSPMMGGVLVGATLITAIALNKDADDFTPLTIRAQPRTTAGSLDQ